VFCVSRLTRLGRTGLGASPWKPRCALATIDRAFLTAGRWPSRGGGACGMRFAMGRLGCGLALGVSGLAGGQDDGFTPLFDGKTLDGWKMINTKDNFFVKDGVLVMSKGKGWLATEKSFGDFELRVRYRFVTPGADSGIFIRSGLEGTNWTNHGYQIQ